MDESEFRGRVRIEVAVLEIWIEQGWLAPELSQGQRMFREIDIARAELIGDLTDRMGVNAAGVDIVMGLLDQIHGLRLTLGDIRTALAQQDEAIQHRILQVIRNR